MGVLQRYVLRELLQVFLLAFVGLSFVFIAAELVQEGIQKGLSIAQVLRIVPLILPGSLPYTVPSTLLLAVTVLFGRLAADNEIMAAKAAGIHVFTFINPAIGLALALSLLLLLASNQLIPRANAYLRLSVLKNFESIFYSVLRYKGQLRLEQAPYEIYVREVEGNWLKGVTLKRRGDGLGYKQVLVADAAWLEFDPQQRVARLHLRNTQVFDENVDIVHRGEQTVVIPLPWGGKIDKISARELTGQLLREKIEELRQELIEAEARHALLLCAELAAGKFPQIQWHTLAELDNQRVRTERIIRRLECEQPFRSALSFGPVFFVLLGCPIAILLQRGDYLSAFVSCFLPIITLYYPLLLLGLNLGKEGLAPPTPLLWAGNVLLLVLSFFALRPVIRH